MNQIQEFMEKLGISEAEAQELVNYDKAVDKGQATEYDLTPEQKKIAKKYTKTGEKTQKSAKIERKKPINEEKRLIIDNIFQFLEEKSGFYPENLDKKNPEREISFQIGQNSYTLTLTKHRK